MTNYITTLQDKGGTNGLLPKTVLKAVADDNGDYLDNQLTASDINALKNGKINTIDTSINKLNILILPNAGSHNSIYRGVDITSYWTDGTLHKRVQGTDGFTLFEDLYVGDYFDAGAYSNIFTNTSSTHYYFAIAGFDTRLKVGDTAVTSHHVVLVPCTSDGSQITQLYGKAIYSSTPFTGGYWNSNGAIDCCASGDTAGSGNGVIYTGLNTIFGSNLLSSRELVSVSNNSTGYGRFGTASGVSTDWAWHTMYATLLSEVEVYGSITWSSSGYDSGMDARGQLPIFRLRPDFGSNRSYSLWLRSVASGSRFCYVGNDGRADYNTASYGYGFAPRFLIK